MKNGKMVYHNLKVNEPDKKLHFATKYAIISYNNHNISC